MRRVAYGLSVLVVALAAVLVPMPLVEFSPGGATSIPERLIEVEPSLELTPIDGDVSLLTVRLTQPSLVETVRALVSPTRDLARRAEVFPQGVESGQYLDQQRDEFRRTFELAVAVGMRAAGEDVQVDSAPVVAQVLPGGPADGRLTAGDVVVALDGVEVASRAELIERASSLAMGQEVVLTVERAGERIDVTVVAGRVPELDRPAIGVSLLDLPLDVELPEGVDMRDTRIGGPSAGLMIAITAYDLWSDEDLVAGRAIAGTGTIDAEGFVGPIGGVGEKVVAAAEAGIDVMLVPAVQEEEARARLRGDLELIAVDTLDEAIAALRASR